jgi:hypothetical protein
MVDLEECDKEEMKRVDEVVYPLLDRVKRGEKISLLDLAPEYREILRERTYGLWTPPGDIQTMLQRPSANLASMLDKGMPVPSILLTPLFVCESKAEFMARYGLVPEMGGPSYDIFLQEIREGRILPFITSAPSHYKGDFYQEILKACEEGIQQLPHLLSFIIPLFMEDFSLIESAIQEGIPLEEGWKDLALQRHPEYDIKSWEKKVTSIFSLQDKEDVASVIAAYGHHLSVFGFSGLANLSLELFREKALEPLECLAASLSYYSYLVSGYSEGLGGLMIYDRVDLERMIFLGIMPERDLLRISPASFSVIGTLTGIPIVVKFDEDDLKNSLRRERDEELEKCMLDSMRAFQRYDFREFLRRNEAINEIVTERIVKETRGYYRRSKIVEGIIISGGTLTLAAGATAAYQYLQPLPDLVSEKTSGIIDAARWLVSRWPFQQKGIPFYLWLYQKA